MPAYIIVGLTPTNTDKLQQYGASVPSTLAQFSGEVLVKGAADSLHGNSPHKVQVIITFPSRQHAIDWYNSNDYQSLIPTRDQGMDSQFQLIG